MALGSRASRLFVKNEKPKFLEQIFLSREGLQRSQRNFDISPPRFQQSQLILQQKSVVQSQRSNDGKKKGVKI
jgi:hypothetical protein